MRGKTYLVAWTVQKQAGRLHPQGEALRRQVIEAFAVAWNRFRYQPLRSGILRRRSSCKVADERLPRHLRLGPFPPAHPQQQPPLVGCVTGVKFLLLDFPLSADTNADKRVYQDQRGPSSLRQPELS